MRVGPIDPPCSRCQAHGYVCMSWKTKKGTFAATCEYCHKVKMTCLRSVTGESAATTPLAPRVCSIVDRKSPFSLAFIVPLILSLVLRGGGLSKKAPPLEVVRAKRDTDKAKASSSDPTYEELVQTVRKLKDHVRELEAKFKSLSIEFRTDGEKMRRFHELMPPTP